MCEIVKHTASSGARRLTLTDRTEVEILTDSVLGGGRIDWEGGDAAIECLEPGSSVWHPVATPADGEALIVAAGTRLRLRATSGPTFEHALQGVIRDARGIAIARERG